MSLKKPITVRVLDREYRIRSDEDEKQVQNIAQFVNNRFKEIKDNTEGLSEAKTSILAVFHIASEYFQALKERDDLAMDIQKRARLLNHKIDSAVVFETRDLEPDE